ncbi:MAG: response regulator [Pseudomonadota bacterium]
MEREYILSILYDLSLTIGAETQLDTLLRKVLQRLLYHTAFPAGLVLTDNSIENGTRYGRIANVIGDHLLEQRNGQLVELPTTSAGNTIELLEHTKLPADLNRNEKYRYCLQLPIDGTSTILLLSPHQPASKLPLTQIFKPVLANLSRAILLCRNSEQLTRTLESDRNQAVEALRASEERFELAMRAANDGLWDWNLQTNAVYYSPRWKSMLGYRDHELENAFNTWEQLVDADDKTKTFALIEDCAAGKSEGFVIEFRMRHKQGHWVFILSRAIMVRDKQGQPLRMVGTHVDISERKAAERAIVEKEKAEATAQAKSQFLANMSHEIRTPLNGVLGLAKIGERENSLGKSQELFRRIGVSGQHLLSVVNDILDFSKIDAGKMVVESQPLKLIASVENATNLIKSQAEEKHLKFHVEVADELPLWVKGDALRLEQILVNLLSNAVKFTEQGEVNLRVTAQDDNLLFRVSDTGIGMSETHLALLFKPFEQADSSTTRRFGGTGLGMAISINLAKIMGGNIQAISRISEGSEFFLSIPLIPAVPERESNMPVIPITGGRLRGLRLLAAEDVEINRMILEDLLDGEEARVEFAEDGQQALELLEAQGASTFDMVLMDVQMPVMDGYEATRRIQEMAPGLPVIGLTAHALEEEREKSLAVGMVDHVTKPIDPEHLIETIQRHIVRFSSIPYETKSAGHGKI